MYKFTLTLYKGNNDQPDLVEKKLYTIHVHFYTDKKRILIFNILGTSARELADEKMKKMTNLRTSFCYKDGLSRLYDGLERGTG